MYTFTRGFVEYIVCITNSADEVCLKAVSEVVPKDTAHHMLAHYYRTVLQSNPTHLDHQSYIGTHFKQWLFGMVQLENGGRQVRQ